MNKWLILILLIINLGTIWAGDGGKDAQCLFKATPQLRPVGTGWEVGVYGGITPGQNGNFDVTSSAVPGVEDKISTQNQVGGVAGFRFGYTWENLNSLLGPKENVPDWIMPAVAYDFFWSGLKYSGDESLGGNFTANLETFTLALEPMLKFRVGAFRPYVGFGIGGTYVYAGNAKITYGGFGANLSGHSNDVCFSISPLVGAEIMITPNWATTFEYKYLYIVDPTLRNNAGPVQYHSDGLGLQLLTAGIKYYF